MKGAARPACEGGLGPGVSVIEQEEGKAAALACVQPDEDSSGSSPTCPPPADAATPAVEAVRSGVVSHRPSFMEGEERMGEAMIRMVENDDGDDGEEREGPPRGKGGRSRGPKEGGAVAAAASSSYSAVLPSPGFDDAREEEDDEEEAEMEFLKSLVVRLMVHSADTGQPFDAGLARDLQFFVGPEVYGQVQEHRMQRQEQLRSQHTQEELRREDLQEAQRLAAQEEEDLLPQIARSLAGLQLKHQRGADDDDEEGEEEDDDEEEEGDSDGEEDDDDKPSDAAAGKKAAGPQIVRLADVEMEMEQKAAAASRRAAGVRLTPRAPSGGKGSGKRRGFEAEEEEEENDDDDDDDDDEDEDGEEDGEEDEWDNDRDCGYVGFPISEQEFYELEEEAMEAAHRAMVAARAGRQVSAWGEDGGATGLEEDLTEAEELLRERELEALKQALMRGEEAAIAATRLPTPPTITMPPPPGPLDDDDDREEGGRPGGGGDGPSTLDDSSTATGGGGGRGGDLSTSALDNNSQVNVEAAVWPRHADDYAFSQAGDEEDEDQSLSLLTNNQAGGRRGTLEGDMLLYEEASARKEGDDDDEEDDDDDEEEDEEARRKRREMLELEEEEMPCADDDEDAEERGGEVEEEDEDLESFNLKVVYERNRTGFEDSKDLQPAMGSLVAGRYRVRSFLGSAVFSTAIECQDLLVPNKDEARKYVCLKIIKNNKDFFDQSLDEIKLLQLLKDKGDPDKHHFLRMYDYFYYKEHLIIVSELLKDNLYEYQKWIKETGGEPYFTLPNLRRIMVQCLEALAFIHSLKLIHCDIKPENIVIRSYSRVEVKLIDFGSSCFTTDNLTSYIQSRSYRAPEVILGLPYGQKIDVWSLGCVLAELLTGYVLFQNDSVQSMLARMIGILGPFPEELLLFGRDVPKYFTSSHILYERQMDDPDGSVVLLYPKKTTLAHRLHTDDQGFLDFVSSLLQLHPGKRPSAEEALRHPWLQGSDAGD